MAITKSGASCRRSRTVVTDRDVELLVLLWRFAVLLRDQAHELAFPGCALRRCNRRLKTLSEEKMIVPFSLPLGVPSGGGFTPQFSQSQSAYCLGPAAVPLVSARTGVDEEKIKRRAQQGSPAYIGHALSVVEIARAFRAEPCSEFEARIVEFRGEPEAIHAFQYRAEGKREWKTETVKPDALALVETPFGTAHLFVESDMGNMSPAVWGTKAALYARYLRTGAFASRYGKGTAFGVLTVTTTQDRSKRLLDAAQEVGAGHCFRFASTFGDLLSGGPHEEIWTDGTEEPLYALGEIARELALQEVPSL